MKKIVFGCLIGITPLVMANSLDREINLNFEPVHCGKYIVSKQSTLNALYENCSAPVVIEKEHWYGNIKEIQFIAANNKYVRCDFKHNKLSLCEEYV